METEKRVALGLAALIGSTPALAADGGPQAEVILHAVEQSAAIPLPYGVRVVDGTIEPSLDTDNFDFVGAIGDRVRLLVRVETELDPHLEVRDPDGMLIVNDACTGGASGCTIGREIVLAKAGTHRITLSDINSDELGGYTLQFERIPPAFPRGRVIGYDLPLNDALDYMLDVDAFRFEGIAGTTMRILVTTSGTLDPHVQVYDPLEALIVNDACTGGCTVSRDIPLGLSGTYYLILSDANHNETGDYSLRVNCLTPSCAPPAAMAVRNGSGVNPAVYSSPCPPILGSTWHAEVDTSSHPGATAVLFLFGGQAAGVPTPCGEALIGFPRLARFLRPVIGDKAVLDAFINNDPVLAGIAVSSQAVILGGQCELTNAIDLVVGF